MLCFVMLCICSYLFQAFLKEIESAGPKNRPPSSDRPDSGGSHSASLSPGNVKISDGGTEKHETSGKKSAVFHSMRSNSIKESKQFRPSLTGSLLKIGSGYTTI